MRQEVPEHEFEKTCNRLETRRTHQGHRLKRNPYRILADAHLQKHLTSKKKVLAYQEEINQKCKGKGIEEDSILSHDSVETENKNG